MKALRIVLLALVVALAVLLVGSAPAGAADPGTTERVSVDSAGNEGDGASWQPAISADGRYVAFYSSAANLVPEDTNGYGDVFVHDRQTGTTERVSVDSSGNEANGSSLFSAISAGGRYVAFSSQASNLVPGDTNDEEDIFVHDRDTDEDGIFDEPGAIGTERVSVDSVENEANDWSWTPAISGGGRYVSFWSGASNLVPDDTNEAGDIFVRDRQAGTTERVSVNSAGSEANGESWYASAMSTDGRYVAFSSGASNLVPGDTCCQDVFVQDRDTDEDGIFDEPGAIATERVSVDSDGNQANPEGFGSWFPAISPDGRYAAFASDASNLVPGDTNATTDIFVHDRQTGITERVSVDSGGSQSDGWSCSPAISEAGRYVSFWSAATNLVASDTNTKADVFVHDRQTGATERASVDSAGNEGSGDDFEACDVFILLHGRPFVSGDGRYVAFRSEASDLVPNDTNGSRDVFVRDRGAQPVGGIAELPDVADSSGGNYIVLAALAAAAVVALSAGGWYARRRWLD